MERKAYPLPVKAELPAQAVRYSDVITRVEIASEVTPTVNFRNADIKALYEDLGMSSKSVGRAVGLSSKSVSRLINTQGIVIRDFNDPIYTERRIASIRRFHLDPVKVAEKNAKVHTPEARIKQANSLRKRYETDPDFSSKQKIRIRKAIEASSRKAAERRSQRAAFLSEQFRLRREEEVQFARRLISRPEFKLLSPRQRQVIELRFREDGGPALTLEQVGEVMGGISRQAVQQYETHALVKLGILKRYKGRKSQKIGG